MLNVASTIGAGLLHAIAKILRLHQVLHEPQENVGQRAARFAGRDEIDVDRWKDAREIAQRLRKTAAIDQGLMEGARHLLNAGMLEPFLENTQAFIKRHSGLEQMAKLLREDEQLCVRNT